MNVVLQTVTFLCHREFPVSVLVQSGEGSTYPQEWVDIASLKEGIVLHLK